VARRPKNAPEPTALHLDFIRASEEEAEARSSAQRQQLEAMAAAQAERETALHKAEEALKQAADAQRKRATMARIRNIALVAVSILALLVGWFAWSTQQQKRIAEEQREQADRILGSATNIFAKLQRQMDFETKKEVLAVFQAGADHGDVTSMRNLGITYNYGYGVPQDYAKAREWYEKAADKGDELAMGRLGLLYQDGQGVPQDSTKAREWFEKAADKGDPIAITNLGVLYEKGWGVAQDSTKAREWYEKAADKGDPTAMLRLRDLYENGDGVAQDYAKALQWQEAYAAKVQPEETRRLGKPGKETAEALNDVAWYALFAREFTRALTAANRAHALLPDDVSIETNRAHALMFLEHKEDAKALYLSNKGKPISEQDNKLWEHVILEDFAEFRKAGLTHPMMADIEKELGVSP